MISVGASTSCFYPLETEKALQKVINLGFSKAEVFFNTVSELDAAFVKEMKKQSDDGGLEVISVHPFSSNLENNCIFGEYERRFNDFIGLYQRHCEAAAELGANVLVIHGAYAKLKRPLPKEHYFERFAKLVEMGRREGVMVCQENVVRFRSQSLDFLKEMRDYLGNDFNMVFDVKQAIRSGYSPYEIAQEMKDSIVHLHLSDSDDYNDCLPPGKGSFDFRKLFDIMTGAGYQGDAVIELYSLGYDMESELAQSKRYFEKLCQK